MSNEVPGAGLRAPLRMWRWHLNVSGHGLVSDGAPFSATVLSYYVTCSGTGC